MTRRNSMQTFGKFCLRHSNVWMDRYKTRDVVKTILDVYVTVCVCAGVCVRVSLCVCMYMPIFIFSLNWLYFLFLNNPCDALWAVNSALKVYIIITIMSLMKMFWIAPILAKVEFGKCDTSDIQISFYHISRFICFSVRTLLCRRQNLPKMCILFCLVPIK